MTTAEYHRLWYQSRSDDYKKRKVALQRQRIRSITDEIRSYKSQHPCGCGESHPACLEFHHVNDDKEFTVADAVRSGWSIKRLMVEIEKCIVLCSNCHRKLHYRNSV